MVNWITQTQLEYTLNHAGPSEVPYSPNQKLVMNFFFYSVLQAGFSKYIKKFETSLEWQRTYDPNSTKLTWLQSKHYIK